MKDLKHKFKIKDPTLIKHWLKGLRSGKYSQIRNKLHIEGTNKFCALGVFYFQNNIPYEGRPYCYTELADFPGGLITEIFKLNDTQNINFLEIADWIERNCELIS